MTPLRLLEYLVPSRARREVLRALRSQGRGLTVLQLSRAVGVAYSAVHREVEQLQSLGLARTERLGNALVCTWNAEHPAAQTVDRLLSDQTGVVHDPDDQTVFWNLRRWGAPLVRPGALGEKLSLETTLAYGLSLARRHSDVTRVWPVTLARNRNEVNLRHLQQLATRLGQKRSLGFFIVLTGRLLKDNDLERWGERLKDGRFRSTEDFFDKEQGARARILVEQRTPPLAREWGLRMNMPMESFESVFAKFVGAK